MSNPAALPNGMILAGEYRLLDVLDAGGFGITYKAVDLSLNKEVVIKEHFPKHLAVRSDVVNVVPHSPKQEAEYRTGLERFIREARILATMSHPNIVRAIRIFADHNTAYFVLEYVHGTNMEDWLLGLGRRPNQDELDLVADRMLGALALLHRNKVLHRDVKPANIFIRAEDNEPVLLDFGAARRVSASPALISQLVVTAQYSPYEAYVSDPVSQGAWTDVYSLAATLFRSITGDAPPTAPDRMLDDRYAVLATRADLAGHYRPEFLAAIDHGLRVRPRDRPQSMEVWRNELLPQRWAGSPHLPLPPAVPLDPIVADPPELAALPTSLSSNLDEMLAWASVLVVDRPSPGEGSEISAPSHKMATKPARRPRDNSVAMSRRQAFGTPIVGLALAALAAAAYFFVRPDLPRLADDERAARRRRIKEMLQRIQKQAQSRKILDRYRRGIVLVPAFVRRRTLPTERVDMTVFAPKQARPRSSTLVNVFLHTPFQAQRSAASARMMDSAAVERGTKSLEIDLAHDSRVDIVLSCNGALIDEPVQTVRWRGTPVFAQFALSPTSVNDGRELTPIVRVSVDGDLIGRIAFRLPIANEESAQQLMPRGEGRSYKYAFVSYASEDRSAVLKQAQMLQATSRPLKKPGTRRDLTNMIPFCLHVEGARCADRISRMARCSAT